MRSAKPETQISRRNNPCSVLSNWCLQSQYKCSSCFDTQEEQGSGYVHHQHRKDLLEKPLHLKQQKRQEKWYALVRAMFMDKRNLSQTGNLEYYYPYRVYKTFFVSPDESL
jgi:hypothetical protein